jgi:hypothetical protein
MHDDAEAIGFSAPAHETRRLDAAALPGDVRDSRDAAHAGAAPARREFASTDAPELSRVAQPQPSHAAGNVAIDDAGQSAWRQGPAGGAHEAWRPSIAAGYGQRGASTDGDLNASAGSVRTPAVGAAGSEIPVSELNRYYRPIWQIVLFTLLSGGLYLFPFVSRCWRFAAAAEGQNTTIAHPRWRAAWQIVPFANLVSFYRLCARLRDVDGGEHYSSLRPGRKVWVLIISGVVSRALPLGIDELGVALVLLAFVPMQQVVNNYCRAAASRDTILQHRLTRANCAGVAFGVVAWAAILYYLVAYDPGAATITFGTGIEPYIHQVTGQTSTFSPHDPFAWSFSRHKALDTSTLTLTIDRVSSTGGPLTEVDDETVMDSDPSLGGLYQSSSIDTIAPAPLNPGTYEMRFWRGQTLIAQGTFFVTAD